MDKPLDSRVAKAFLGFCAMVWLLAPGSIAGSESKAPAPATNDHHGYALLYDLLGDEQNVSKLLIIKRDRPELKTLVKQISEEAGKAHKELDKLGKHDRALNLKDMGLPAGEVETRKSIAKEKAKELLAEKGKDFEIALLLTQNEALTYGAHLAQTVARLETDPERNRFLQQLSSRLVDLRNKVVGMLHENLK
jgi:hypothetical protein